MPRITLQDGRTLYISQDKYDAICSVSRTEVPAEVEDCFDLVYVSGGNKIFRISYGNEALYCYDGSKFVTRKDAGLRPRKLYLEPVRYNDLKCGDVVVNTYYDSSVRALKDISHYEIYKGQGVFVYWNCADIREYDIENVDLKLLILRQEV